MAGATSCFSLRRRTPGCYVRERVTRLPIPFVIGAMVLTPLGSSGSQSHPESAQNSKPDSLVL
jgi:hypothetical protein